MAALSRWNYRLRYALQRHFEQDAINGQIDFNLGGQASLKALALSRDLFDNLAEMTQVFPQVVADLNRYLLPLDIDSQDPAQIENAEAALLSAGAMVGWRTAPAAPACCRRIAGYWRRRSRCASSSRKTRWSASIPAVAK